MTLDEVIKIIDGQCDIKENLKINNIKTNSNDITDKDVFLAIENGINYIDNAIKNGAIAIITEKKIVTDITVIYVESTIKALGMLAKYYRAKYDIPLIAITGSTGKTTTKEFLSKLLESKYNVLKSSKNQNNHIGLPNTLLKLNSSFDIIITELGMNHFKEISYLSNICKPDYAIITNIGTAHIGNLGSKKNILKAKLEILDGMDNGLLIVNNEDKLLKKLRETKVKMIKEGINKSSLGISNIKYFDDHTEFDLNIKNQKRHFYFHIPGKHMLIDLLLSIKLATLFNINIDIMKEVVFNLKNEQGRFNIIKKNYTLIDDSYNSSYEALSESLNYIKHQKNKKIIILGDMLELGKLSKKYHKKINKKLKKIKNKEILLIGKETKVIKGKHFESITSLQMYLNNIEIEDCLILIKGSRKMQLDKLILK